MILKVKDLEFYYHTERPIFHDVNFSLEAGEVLSILGPNGAGKTTLLNCLANLLTPVKGEIFLDGKNVRDIRLREIAQILGYVPQSHNAAYAYEVRDFVVMGRAPYLGMFQKPSKEDYALTDEVIESMGISRFARQPYTQISGGERQQAMIARAIVQQPKIIMFDEPTNHLDYGNQLRMIRKIRALSKGGYTVVMTTHMPDHAMMLGGKTAILDRQGNLKTGPTEDIITEKALQEIYQEEIQIAYVEEAGRRVCVFRDDKQAAEVFACRK